jgi:putative holliday junction resolvase
VGTVRIGVAICDDAGATAVPLETVGRDSGGTDLDRLAALAAAHEVVEVVVGLPLSLNGREGPAAVAVREYAGRLAAVVPAPVRLVDERMTTSGAQRALRAGGVPGKRHRAVIDQAAAAMILQNALDSERSTGRPPGVSVSGGTSDQGEA